MTEAQFCHLLPRGDKAECLRVVTIPLSGAPQTIRVGRTFFASTTGIQYASYNSLSNEHIEISTTGDGKTMTLTPIGRFTDEYKVSLNGVHLAKDVAVPLVLSDSIHLFCVGGKSEYELVVRPGQAPPAAASSTPAPAAAAAAAAGGGSALGKRKSDGGSIEGNGSGSGNGHNGPNGSGHSQDSVDTLGLSSLQASEAQNQSQLQQQQQQQQHQQQQQQQQ